MGSSKEVDEHMNDHIANLGNAYKGYDAAINYYTTQRRQFLAIYNQATGLEEEASQFLSHIGTEGQEPGIDTLASDYATKKTRELVDGLYEVFQTQVKNMNKGKMGGKKENLVSAAQKFRDAKDSGTDKAEASAREEFNKIIDDIIKREDFNEVVLQRAREVGLITEGSNFDYSTFTRGMYTLRNAVFRDYLTGHKDFKGVKANAQPFWKTKGYIAESTVYDAFYKALTKFSDGFSFNVTHGGSGNEAGGEDIGINLEIPREISVTGETSIKPGTLHFGIQSKSWDLTSEDAKAGKITLSRNEKLKNKINAELQEKKHSWCEVVKKLSEKENILTATDNSFIWRTSHGLMWTDEMLRRVEKELKAYIAFSWDAKESIADSTNQLLIAYEKAKKKSY